MRKIKSYDSHGFSVQEILDEFNERREEFDVADGDIISVSSGPPMMPIKVMSQGIAKEAIVRVSIFYWSDE